MSEAIETVNPEATALPEAGAESAETVAQPSAEGTDAQAIADAADPIKQAAEEDPEIEFGDGLKFRRSEAARQLAKRKELDRAAFAKFEEAAKIRKQWEQIQQADPEEFFKARGVDPTQFAIDRLKREVAMREATPEQRALMEAQARVAALEQEKQSYAEEKENARVDAEKQQFISRLNKELPEVVKKSGLPHDPIVYRQIAGVMGEQLNSGVPVDPESAAEIVADSYRDTFHKYVETLNYDALVKQHPALLKVVREGDLARARSGAAAPARPAATNGAAPKKPAEPKGDGGKKFNDFFDPWAGMGVVRPPTST